MMNLIVLLLGAHYVADYGLQNEYIVKFKRPGMPAWLHVMSGHCAIHGVLAYLATGQWWVFFVEFVAHFIIDCLKSLNIIGYTTDQVAHLFCKMVYVIVLVEMKRLGVL